MQAQDFEQLTLLQLYETHPQLSQLNGSVIFRADAQSRCAQSIAWVFNENDEAYLRELGLKETISQVVDRLINFRIGSTVLPVYEGVIDFMRGQFMIEWRTH